MGTNHLQHNCLHHIRWKSYVGKIHQRTYLNVNLAKVFNLFIRLVPNMKVMVADGKKIDNVEKCHKVKLQMQEYNLESDFLVVPLG